MKLINIIKGLPIIHVNGYGPLIIFSSIVNACKLYGQDNSQMIEVKLKDLEKHGLLSVIYDENELLIGVKLSD